MLSSWLKSVVSWDEKSLCSHRQKMIVCWILISAFILTEIRGFCRRRITLVPSTNDHLRCRWSSALQILHGMNKWFFHLDKDHFAGYSEVLSPDGKITSFRETKNQSAWYQLVLSSALKSVVPADKEMTTCMVFIIASFLTAIRVFWRQKITLLPWTQNDNPDWNPWFLWTKNPFAHTDEKWKYAGYE